MLWASATTPEIVIAMFSSICRSFLPLRCAMNPPEVTLVSVAKTTPSLQTSPTVVVPWYTREPGISFLSNLLTPLFS